jgi:hypothetical protein
MKPTITSLAFALALGALSLGASSFAAAQQALTEPQVHDKLTAQGYTRVHDLKFKDGMWKAKAENSSGNDVKLKIDASSGKVIGTD